METMSSDVTSLDRFRWVAWLEGASFLLLLGVAMPLKYIWGQPLGVRVVGMGHGLLFLAYLGLLIQISIEYSWPWRRIALAAVASLLPFGPFVFESYLRRQTATESPNPRS
jgi:integral membrane protein